MMLLMLGLSPVGCSDYGFGHPDEELVMECYDRFFDAGEVPTDPACQAIVENGSLENIIEWKKEEWSIVEAHAHSASMPIALPIDGDGIPDVLVITHYQGRALLRAISGVDGRELWTVDEPDLQKFGGLAGGDIDGDGLVEIVTVSQSNKAMAYEHDGTPKWVSERTGVIPETHAYPAIANLDGTGNPEIIVGAAIFDADGNTLGKGSHGRGGGAKGTTAFASDLDQDGVQEVVVGNALYDMLGNAIWFNGQPDGHPAVADLDRDGEPEIIVSSFGSVRAQSSVDGTVLWTTNLSGTNSGPPVIADFNGDGLPEIGVSSTDRFSVLDGLGEVLWFKAVTDPSGFLAASAFDFESDGLPEVFFIDEQRAWIFYGPDGTVRTESAEHSSATELEYGIIVDVDADGQAEIVIPSMPEDGNPGGPNKGITSFGAIDGNWRPARGIWNQHAYSITNINDDGSVPEIPAPNWLSYNNFRAGDLVPNTGFVLADLTVELLDLCEFECNEGRIVAWVTVGNEGLADVYGSVTVQLMADTDEGPVVLDEIILADGLPYGESLASFRMEAEEVSNLTINDVYVQADGGNSAENQGLYKECKEDNNEDWWGAQTCAN